MLIYHPAYDVNHGMFRMLRLLDSNPAQEMQWDTYRILDFYYLFPHLLVSARLPQSMSARKKAFGRLGSAYTRIPSPRQFLRQLEGIHETIARSLAAKGFVEASKLNARLLSRTELPLPASISQSFSDALSDQLLVNLLAVDLAEIPLTGENGLKRRTGLLEHRYDAA